MKRKCYSKKSFRYLAKRIISLCLVLCISISMFSIQSRAGELPAATNDEAINIGIATDIHISRSDSASGKVKETLLHNCLKGFYKATSNNLDAIAIAGDLTDNGYVDELQTFRSILDSELDSTTAFTAVMGNHEFYKYGWGVSVDENAGMKDEMQNDFTTNIKVPIESDISIKGVHILSVSPDNELDSYTARESFLKEKISAAAVENPTNPIIIIAHKPVKYTVISSGTAPDGTYASLAADWSDSFLEFLKQYPQIIYFSGHAHDDLSNPDNIYQEDFTSVQAGAVLNENASTGVLVSIDNNKVVTIKRMNFSTDTSYEPAWTIDIPKVIESKENFQYRAVNTTKNTNLTIGADASELYVNWYNDTYKTGKVQFSKKSNFINGVLSAYDEVTALNSGEAEDEMYYNHAVIKNLEAETEYIYRVGNDDGWSEYYTFKTPASSGNFNFLFAADAQIGSEGVNFDVSGWKNTITNAITTFPNAQFLLSAGDQVNAASNSSQYDGFFSPSQLTSLPIATIVGNHDVNSILYSQHFAYSNISENTSMKSTGEYSGDYWFVRNNTLFMTLNSNVVDTQEHINFMQQAILDAGDAIKWKIVMFHHSVFSTAGHSIDNDVIQRRAELPLVFSNLQIDMVLMGHDHTYCRTYMMDGTTPISANGVESAVTNPAPGQVLYVTGNSASGSKFYDMINEGAPYAAVTYQNSEPSVSNVEVSETALTITTYNSADMEVKDSFTINKTQTSTKDTLKPYLFVPTTNTVILNQAFDKLAGVSAIDNVDGDITKDIMVTGDVDTGVEGEYTLNYTISDAAGNQATAIRKVIVKKENTATGISLHFGIDIKNGKLENEEGSAILNSSYTKTGGGYEFEEDSQLNQKVLCGPEKENLIIDGLNLRALDNQFTVETYIKIPSELSPSDPGKLTDYDVFQFDGQSINLVGRPGETYFGAGKYQSEEDADVYATKNLPTDEWIHILCTAKEGEQTLYVNGKEFSKGYFTTLNISKTTNDELVLGGSSSDRSGLMKYAYFRIYSGFVNDEQAAKMYTEMQNVFLQPADYTAVDNAIANIPADLSLYTDASVKALLAAKEAVIRGKKITEQAIVDAYATAINNAVKALDFKDGADYTAVNEAIAKIPADLSLYTDDTVSILNAAKEAVIRGKSTVEQAIVDAYATAIENAVKALEYKAADYTAVDEAIAGIPSDLSAYTVDSVNALNTAKDAVIRGKNITEQAIVDAYAAAIENAVKALNQPGFIFGIDIKNGKLKNETGSDVSSSYLITGNTGGFEFEKDDELNQNVLCGPEKENLIINNLNLGQLNNQFTVETYIKIPSELSPSAPGTMTAYDVFQFDGQNINLVGVSNGTYFGAGRFTGGDADVYSNKKLPTDQWIHVLCTAKEGKQTLYVNGEKFVDDTYTGLNIASSSNCDELVLGGITSSRSGLIKYAYFRLYSNFVNDELEAQNMYQAMKNSFPPDDTTIDIVEINGVAIPKTGKAPTAAIEDTSEYTATISWFPADAAFAADTVYQATITLVPKQGYTLSGVTENFFKVAGANTVRNDADSGVITAEFPATEALTLERIDITKQADKLEYIVGDSLDISGMVVTGTYNNNTNKTETVTLSDITGFDSSVPVESQILTVTVKGKTTTYTVTIKKDSTAPVGAIISPTTVTYDLNQPEDVHAAIIWNSAQSIVSVKCGSEVFTSKDIYSVSGSAISVSGSALTIQSGYLFDKNLKQGDTATFHITFDNGNTASLTVNIVNGYIPSNDASLNYLTIGGKAVKGFAPELFRYDIELPYGVEPGSEEATVYATSGDPKAEVKITQAVTLPGSAIIVVTAEDKLTTKTYTVNLTLSEPQKPAYTLTISAKDGGSIMTGDNGAYTEGTLINISAAPLANYRFSQWSSSNGGSFGNVYDASTTFTMPAQETTITASFTYMGGSYPIPDIINHNDSHSDSDSDGNKEPVIKEGELSGWNSIENYIKDDKKENLTVEMKNNTVVPGSLFKTIRGKDIQVSFLVEDGIEWIVKGEDIPETDPDKEQKEWKDIDLKVTKNTDAVPSEAIDPLLKSEDITTIPISLNYEGEFGFTATLRMDLGSKNAGRTANLFYYNPKNGELELQEIGIVDKNGYSSFEFEHASDYVVMMDNGTVMEEELKGITVTPESKLLYVGGSIGKRTNMRIEYPQSIKAMLENDICTPEITYQSGDKNVAFVLPNGKIYALNQGETTITTVITMNGVSISFKSDITVKEAYIELIQSTDIMKKGQSYLFQAVGHGVDTNKISWKTTKKSMVVINKTTGKAKAMSSGVDYVVAKAGSIQAKMKVKVK